FALLPWSMVQRMGALMGWLMWKLPNRSREVARINLARCFPELDEKRQQQLLGDSLQQIGKTFTESACAWIWPADKTLRLVKEVEGLEVLEQALASGKGVVGITSHLGNWEVINHFYCAQCKPIIFYRPPKSKAVDDLLQRLRLQLVNRGARSTPEGLISVREEVHRGRSVSLPADPAPREGPGVRGPLFATQALTSKFVPGMLTGGKAVGVFLHALRLEDGSGFKVILEAAPQEMYSEDIDAAVASMSRVIESYV